MQPQQENYFLIILISAALLLLLTGYFVFTLIRQQRRIMKWQQARIRAEIETLEKERRRIATDLHDEIGPMLSAVKLQINHLDPEEESEVAALERSSQQIDQVIQQFRDISYNLLPNTLVRKGLVKAVEEFIYRVYASKDLVIDFVSDELMLDKETEVNLFRIIQEIVHNTIKHARATRLDLQLRQGRNFLSLHAKDNGIGFSYQDKVEHANGLGLLNLQSRVEVLKAKLIVTTAEGKGTMYLIEVPLNPKDDANAK
jgi:two-component system NarL family sensor kinase